MKKKFTTFKDFYPFYLSQHQNKTCKILHVIGSSLVIILLIFAVAKQETFWLLLMPIAGYGFAWLGHFFFEHNKPATFQYPFYSLLGDWVMFKDLLTGKLTFE